MTWVVTTVAGTELRETSGMTTRLVLEYARREGGDDAVARLLDLAGCTGREAELCDESAWFSFATKIRLFEGLCDALGDPDAVRRAGEAAIAFNIADGLKVALRALGSPTVVYRNVVRANAKFSAVHSLELLTLDRDACTLAFSDNVGYDIHPLDCAYTQGLLSAAPVLFGLPLAQISHPVCACDGHERCVYDIRWQAHDATLRAGVAVGLVAGVSMLGAAVAAPALLPLAAGVSAITAAVCGLRVHHGLRAHQRHLQHELRDRDAVAQRMTASLQDLVGELDLDEVLDKIAVNARAAVGSKEFVVLVSDDDGALRCRASSGVPQDALRTLEAWVAAEHPQAAQLVLVEDVALVPGLAELAAHASMPVGSLCLAPLAYRDANVGALLALAPQARTFLPRDLDLVSSYAVPAAIALANARHFAAQRSLATRDPLTGLLNHREFHESLERELERARRSGGTLGIAMFDLDGFKLVNDSAGHAEGDRLLRAVADTMERTCRSSDMAFRVGGDEFALVLPGSGRDEAEAVAERVRRAVASIDARVSASIGMASWPDDGGSKDVLLAHADAALYSMKSAAHGERSAREAGETPGVAGARAHLRERLVMANRLCGKLTPILEPQHIAAAVVTELHHSFGYLLAYVHRVEDDTLRTIALGGTATDELDLPLWTQGVDQGVSGRVVRTGRTALVHDTALDADHIGGELLDLAGELVLRSELAVPLRVAGRVWGVLSIQAAEPGAFGPDDVLLLEMVGAQVAAALHRSALYAELDTAFATMLGVLGGALEAKDDSTAEHARDVADIAGRLGVRLGLDEDQVRAVRYAALLHDIGKIAIRTEILTKPGPLTASERTEMERHSAIGAELLQRIAFFENVHPIVRSAHERWDGAGYPDRLAGEAIPLGARIVSVCDAYHAMTSDRPYRAAMLAADAVAELRRCAGTQFDERVVDALLAELRPLGDPEPAGDGALTPAPGRM